MIEFRDTAYGRVPLPAGIRSRIAAIGNGLDMHFLEAGFEERGRPCALLLHGFPELAYSWRHVMPALAQAGFHVIAPDQRGYGRTTGWDSDYDGDLASYRLLNRDDACGGRRGDRLRPAVSRRGRPRCSRRQRGLQAGGREMERKAVVSPPFGGPVSMDANPNRSPWAKSDALIAAARTFLLDTLSVTAASHPRICRSPGESPRR